MKKIIFFLAINFLLIFTIKPENCLSQWTQTSGPFGGNINCLYTNGAVMYAGTGNGIYSSADNGLNWSLYSTSLSNHDVRSICFAGSNIFTIIQNIYPDTAKLVLSTDNGTSWNEVFRAGGSSNYLTSIVSIGNDVFVTRRDEGIFKTTNSGLNWAKVKNGRYNTLLVNGNELFAGGFGIVRSTNNGIDWDSLASIWDCRAICVSGSNIFANSWEEGLYFSSNNGLSWNTVNNGLLYQHIMTLEILGSSLFAGTESNGIFLSTNYGTNWSVANTGLTCDYVRTIRKIGTSIISGTAYGIYGSTNAGSTWSFNNNGIKSLVIEDFYNYNNNMFAVAQGGVFLSTNNGDVWNVINNSLDILDINSITGIGSTVFIAARGVYKTSNNGATWIEVSNGLPANVSKYDICASGSSLFVGTYNNGIYMSSDNGSNWIPVNNGLPANTSILDIEGNGIIIYASSYNTTYASSNNGSMWRDISQAIGGSANSFTFDGTNVYAGRNDIVYLSTNNGDNWTSLGLFNSYISSLGFSNPYLIVGTQKGIFITSDNGNTWFNKDQGFNISPWIRSLKIANNYIFTGPYSVWRRSFSEIIGIQNISIEIPTGFSLSQNYPNPFNPTTSIEFSLPQKSYVKLKVFDITGKELTELVNKNLSAGTFRYDFNAGDLSSGLYFYKLEAEKFSETKRMILLK